MSFDPSILKYIEEALLGFEIRNLVKWCNVEEQQLQSIIADLESKKIIIKEVLQGDEGEEYLTIYTHKRWYYAKRCEECELLVAADDTHVCEGPRTPTFVE